MLRKIYICALQVDAGRRPRWITPCKRSAARGGDRHPSARTAKRFNPLRGCRDAMHRVSTPSCACGLQGVIQIRRLPASTESVQKVLRSTFYEMSSCSTFCAMSSCGLKSRIFITAGHRPAERIRILHDCLKGRTPNADNSPAFQAASRERRPIRGSMTRSGAVETGHALSLHDCRAASRQGRTCVFARLSTACKTVPCVTSINKCYL
jgi:hypothetical protein